jgi:hypothetical protein
MSFPIAENNHGTSLNKALLDLLLLRLRHLQHVSKHRRMPGKQPLMDLELCIFCLYFISSVPFPPFRVDTNLKNEVAVLKPELGRLSDDGFGRFVVTTLPFARIMLIIALSFHPPREKS